MKRLAAIFSILAVLILVGLLSIWRLSRDQELYVSRVDAVEASLLVGAPDEELLGQTRLDWENETKLLTLFLYHEALEEITRQWLDVQLCVQAGEYTAAYKTLEQLRLGLEHLLVKELPLAQNVL